MFLVFSGVPRTEVTGPAKEEEDQAEETGKKGKKMKKEKRPDETPSVTTAKSTLGHTADVTTRDGAYKVSFTVNTCI